MYLIVTLLAYVTVSAFNYSQRQESMDYTETAGSLSSQYKMPLRYGSKSFWCCTRLRLIGQSD